MKNKTIFILVMVVLFWAGSASADLVAYWTLDEPFGLRVPDPPWNYDFPRAEDYRDGDPAGNAARPNDGKLISAVNPPIMPGKLGTIHYIDYLNNEYDGGALMVNPTMGLTYIDCGSSTTSSLEWNDPNWADITDEITVAAWIKADEFGPWPSHRGIVTKSNAVEGGSGWALYRTDVVQYEFVHCPECPTPNYGLTFYVGVPGMPPFGLNSWFSSEWDMASFWNGDWHYVVGTYDGSKAVIYIDGVENNSIDCSGPIATNDWDVWIGNWASTGGSTSCGWRGGIDDVRVYDEALSAEEVYDLYLEGMCVYYVDGVNGNDSNDGLSKETAFATIQMGIDTAVDDCMVLVYPGLYQEEIDFLGKAITVAGAADAPVLEAAVVAAGHYAVSFYHGEGSSSVFKNFVVANSHTGFLILGCTPTISNITVVDNETGILASGGAGSSITNSIFWNNASDDLVGCQASYSCIESGDPGVGNISSDPLFADAGNDDYHLLSEYGRYVSQYGLWSFDEVSSPCIDAGDPSADPQAEGVLNGGRINMGAYGGTAYASKSLWYLVGDLNRDGIVDFFDFAMLADDWRDTLPWAL